MERALSPEEQLFIDRFKAGSRKVDRKEEKIRRSRRQAKASRRFSIVLGSLIILPFLFSAGLLFQLAKLNDSAGVKQLKYLQTTLPQNSYKTIQDKTGVGSEAKVSKFYDERYGFVLIIFVVFIIIIGIVVLLRLLKVNRQRRKDAKEL